MQAAAITAIKPPRVAKRDAMLIFGLASAYHCDNKAGLPAQWERFVPYLGTIENVAVPGAYGVICNADEAGNFDYICGVEVREFPVHPREFTRLRIPPQTYAVFMHEQHISSIGATCNAIWNQALPESKYKPADGPWFEYYGENFDGRTGMGGVEIWIPIQAQ